MVDLSFAGRQRHNHSVLVATTEARIGDALTLVRDHDRWQLTDTKGRSLGRMAKSYSPPRNARFVRGEIAAILRWRKDDSDEAFHHTIKRDDWEVIVPELVFEEC
jgi:ATP-dependent DNA helicase RecQ